MKCPHCATKTIRKRAKKTKLGYVTFFCSQYRSILLLDMGLIVFDPRVVSGTDGEEVPSSFRCPPHPDENLAIFLPTSKISRDAMRWQE